jgi:selenocysteine lyase/cysteine desulfurase
VLRPLHRLESDAIVTTTCVPPRDDGSIHADDVIAAFRPTTRLVVMSHASNVTGAIAPAEAVGRAAVSRGIRFLLDAAQSVGRIPVDVEACAVDLLAFSPDTKALMGPGAPEFFGFARASDAASSSRGRHRQSFGSAVPTRGTARAATNRGLTTGPDSRAFSAAVRWFERTGPETVLARHREISERLLALLGALPGVVVPGPRFGALRGSRSVRRCSPERTRSISPSHSIAVTR